ncbi:MAG: triple tyrosine motif-containing protein [Breznakibacter sp.]
MLPFRIIYRLFLTVVFLFVSVASSKAQTSVFGIPQIKYFNRSDYNAGTQNWCISQANNGLVYIANNFGVMEYDGTEFRVLPFVSQSVSRTVLAVNDRVYVGANDEFGYYERVNGIDFEYFSLNKKYGIDEIGDFWGIFQYNDQIIFQSEKALCLYKPDSGIEVVKARSRIPNAFLVNGLMLVHDELEGLLELRQGKLFKMLGGEKFAGIRVCAILPLPNDELLVGTMTNGLYRISSQGVEKWNVSANDYLTQHNIFCGTKSGDDLVFGTIQSGIVVVTPNGTIKTIANKDKGLGNNTVLGVFVDRDNHIWAGLDNGIARIDYNSPITFIQGYFDLGTGYCMARQKGKVYFGTNQGLYIIDEQRFGDPRKERTDFKRITGTNGQVWTIFTDTDGTILCGHDHGVYRIDGTTAHYITPTSVVGAWTFRHIPNRNDLLLVGTYKGLVIMQKKNGTWDYLSHVEGFEESSRFMEWDAEGKLWITHGLKGIFRLTFSPDYRRLEKIERGSDLKGLDNDKEMTLSIIDGHPVFASPHGLFTYSAATHAFTRHTLENYFDPGKVSFPNFMTQDRFGNIWYFEGGNVGVLRHLDDGSYRKVTNPFAAIAGKTVNGFESTFVWDEKSVLFGVEDGFAHYQVSERTNYLTPFSIHIRGFSGTNTSNPIFYSGSDRMNIDRQTTIPEYPFAGNAFDVSYSATWFGSGNVEYATYLQGFDEKWGDWGLSKKRQFTRLPEGSYVFWVKARNIHGVETEQEGFRFTVLPPWYRSAWAKTGYTGLVLAILALWFAIARRIMEKSRKREVLKQQEQFRLKEEQLNHEALVKEKEMIRLRNEKLHNEMLHKEKELANSAIHVVQKNEFLIKVKEELLKAMGGRDLSSITKRIGYVVKHIDNDIENESHWEVFETHLEQVHADFLKRLQEKHSDLLPRELKLCAYLRMGMSSKEISSLMNIGARAVENNRYKLRKKLGLDQGDNLIEYIMGL